MQACTFIFNKTLTAFFLLLSLAGILAAPCYAQLEHKPGTELGDDNILSGPFSEYGEFDSSEDEAANERFFQYGRFFGIGLGTGLTVATGNAGKIYQGTNPMIDFRLDYWFDFQFALQTSIQNSKHSYDLKPDGLSDVNLFRILFQVKYYFDTHNLSAPITFVGPHLIVGGGLYQRTDNIGIGAGDTGGNNINTQNTFGLNFGGGFELTLKPKKTYFQIEGLIHMAQFGDQYDPKFKPLGIPDRSGPWVSVSGALMWTW